MVEYALLTSVRTRCLTFSVTEGRERGERRERGEEGEGRERGGREGRGEGERGAKSTGSRKIVEDSHNTLGVHTEPSPEFSRLIVLCDFSTRLYLQLCRVQAMGLGSVAWE